MDIPLYACLIPIPCAASARKTSPHLARAVTCRRRWKRLPRDFHHLITHGVPSILHDAHTFLAFTLLTLHSTLFALFIMKSSLVERGPSVEGKASRVEYAWSKLSAVAEELCRRSQLSRIQTRSVELAKGTLESAIPTERRTRRRLYQYFMYTMLRDFGAGAVLLCAAALRLTDLTSLTLDGWCKLHARMRGGGIHLHHRELFRLAVEHQLPYSVDGMYCSPPRYFVARRR